MKTESEIITSPLIERQKLWVEKKLIATNDRDYANARAILELIEGTDDWEAPKQNEAVATADTQVDGKSVKKGETIKVYEWQFNALRRHLANPDELKEKAARKVKAGSAAGLIIGAMLLVLGWTTEAQTQTYVIGAPGTYNVVSVAGLYGGTNSVLGTNSTYGVGVITTNTAVVPNWTFSNGIWTNTPSTNVLNVVTNTPGVVSVVNLDMFNIVFGAALNAAGTSVAVASFDTSDDLQYWQTNKIILPLTMAGTGPVSTNYPATLFPPGYIRLNYLSYPSTTVSLTNVVVTVSKKPGRTGP